MKNNKRTNYKGVDSTVMETNYFYNKDLQLSKKESNSSDGTRQGSVFLYTTDFNDNVLWIKQLKDNNLKVLIEHVNYHLDNGQIRILDGIIHEYQSGGKGLRSKTKVLSNSVNRLLSTFKFSNSNIGLMPTSTSLGVYSIHSDYKDEIQFVNYDSFGNVLEIRENGTRNKVVLWGYNGQYPIAKIENATYAEVLTSLGTSATTILNSLNAANVSAATIATHTNTLRTKLSKANVVSYTYEPLVGMTSMTDPRGITEYYKYDGFQRLKDVLDFENNILKNYQYHYRTN